MNELRKPRLAKRMTIMLIVILVLFALLIGFNVFKGIMIGKFMKSMGNPPQTVSTMKAEYQNWQPHVDAVGNVRAVHGSDLSFDVSGLVESVPVKSGADVKASDVLVKLSDADDRAK
ncbi:MAG: efflux RND transporter periplasmic adaptor subunit, partial [Rhodanobacteraceae bacterium]